MPEGAITGYADVAQLCLYGFWLFFIGLVFYLRREDRREGYPTEEDRSGRVKAAGPIFIPKAKEYPLMEGGVKMAPDFARDDRAHAIARVGPWGGAPYEPTGDAMIDGVGPAAWAQRKDTPEQTRDGRNAVVPTRVANDFHVVDRDVDPRGVDVVAADGVTVGKCSDLWVDRADPTVRYLEIDVGEGRTVLAPMNACRVTRMPEQIKIKSLLSAQFAHVPGLANPDQISVLEEEKIMAYYAGGRFFAEASRREPLV